MTYECPVLDAENDNTNRIITTVIAGVILWYLLSKL